MISGQSEKQDSFIICSSLISLLRSGSLSNAAGSGLEDLMKSGQRQTKLACK